METNPVLDFEKSIDQVNTVPATIFGKSLIIAPHPDDETLGCGGTVALLLQAGIAVHFVFVSDGTMSHPHSAKYPAARLRALREAEAIAAVEILGGSADNVTFLGLPDRQVPAMDSLFFESSVRNMLGIIRSFAPATIFVPWQNDPHPDHRASYQIVTEAAGRLEQKPRIMQYPIWLWEMGNSEDVKLIREMRIMGVDIDETVTRKQAALQAHQSQISDLIDDDPDGFRLSPEIIAHFEHTREIFFENVNTEI